ncbi:DUF3592 domain-containing protein [Actinomadura rubrobrunea]|uniref:DUF3592 domain-containing protein n=1 Tax=Actinomadura rubrobrunea TaxID=115335 RepID=UPI00083797C7|nr:DUF3592 domain-containing protein [Actinomadura rubrobrunea]
MSVSLVPWVVSLGLLLVGVLTATWAVRELGQILRDLRRFHRAEGEVVDVRQDWYGDGSSYHPVVRFRTSNGTSVQAPSRHGDRSPGAHPGQRVTVCYNPANPQDVFLAGWWRSGMGAWTLCFVAGTAFAAFATYGLTVLLR